MRITISNRNSTAIRATTHQFRRGLSVSIVVLAIVGAAFGETGPKTDPGTLTIRVFNYSQASRAAIIAAEREASRILAAVGVHAVWLQCKAGKSTVEAP